MPMPMHDHGASAEVEQPTNEPATVDESGPDTLGQFLCRLGIFDDVMMQSDDPMGTWVLIDDSPAGAILISGHETQRIGK